MTDHTIGGGLEEFTLAEPPLETDQAPVLGQTMLTVAQWAERHGVEPRSARRYVQKDKLPGAVMEDGRWLIPADAEVQARPQGQVARRTPTTPAARQATAHAHTAPAAAGTLQGLLDQEPAYLDLATAARLMGLDAQVLVRHRERYGVERLGALDPKTRRRAWLVPQATVRAIAGLAR